MGKRLLIRIVYEVFDLKDLADLEEKIEETLAEYGVHEVEISLLSTRVTPLEE